MRLSFRILFLTFVLLGELSWSAPSKPMPKKKQALSSQNEFDDKPGPTKTEPTQVTYPAYPDYSEPLPSPPPPLPRRGKNDINFQGGILGGDILEVSENQSTQYFGVRWIPHETFTESWDFTANVHLKKLISVEVGHRWYIEDDDYFKSYYRFAAADFIDSSQGLGGLINLRHIKVLASYGVSDFFDSRRRFSGEIGTGYGLGGFITYLQLAYNLNF